MSNRTNRLPVPVVPKNRTNGVAHVEPEMIEPGELDLLQAVKADLLNAQGVWTRISRHLATKYQLADGESISPETGQIQRVVYSQPE